MRSLYTSHLDHSETKSMLKTSLTDSIQSSIELKQSISLVDAIANRMKSDVKAKVIF